MAANSTSVDTINNPAWIRGVINQKPTLMKTFIVLLSAWAVLSLLPF